jgi:transcriptional regulator with XRE-family HTH domain
MNPEDFASALRAARRKKKLTMFAVADLTGSALPIYKMFETGRIYPHREPRDPLCEALGVNRSDNGDGNPQDE